VGHWWPPVLAFVPPALVICSTIPDKIYGGTYSKVVKSYRKMSFTDSVCDSWEAVSSIPHLSKDGDTGCVLFTCLQQLFPATQGCLQKLLAAMTSLALHSMQVERVVSHYNNLRTSHRLSLSLDTVNPCLMISISGVGTVQFDPRPCVAKFLTVRVRREGHSDPDIYTSCFTVASFFNHSWSLWKLWVHSVRDLTLPRLCSVTSVLLEVIVIAS